MAVSPEFAHILRAGRPQFNARVSEARRRYPGFDQQAFAEFLQLAVDPLLQAVHRVAPDACTAVAMDAYDIGLNLIGRDIAGPKVRSPLINTLWLEILPLLAPQIAEKPQLLLGALSNALVNIEGLPQARPQQWLQSLRELGPQAASAEQLLLLGVLAAWCAGAAHFRNAALNSAAQLPAQTAQRILGLENTHALNAVLSELHRNPWHIAQLNTPEAQNLQHQVGGFSGFGGGFSEPPQLRVNQDGFVIKSGERYQLLVADGFGSVCLPASASEYHLAQSVLGDSDAPLLRGNILRSGTKKIGINLPAKGLALACNAHTIALCSPLSFHIILVPR